MTSFLDDPLDSGASALKLRQLFLLLPKIRFFADAAAPMNFMRFDRPETWVENMGPVIKKRIILLGWAKEKKNTETNHAFALSNMAGPGAGRLRLTKVLDQRRCRRNCFGHFMNR